MKQFHVAIDGPAGSGKSTISKLIAEKIKYTHIDTGAMYRAVTWYAIYHRLPLEKIETYDFLETVNISYHEDKILVDNIDVSDEIRTEVVTSNVSLVSSFKIVRDKMVDLQRKAAIGKKVVMDGRDIGTTVLPNANIKIFLTANVEERAKRRYSEQLKKGIDEPIDIVLEEIKIRDYKDSHRKESPLRKASDAITLDTTYLKIEEVVDKIIDIINKGERQNGH